MKITYVRDPFLDPCYTEYFTFLALGEPIALKREDYI